MKINQSNGTTMKVIFIKIMALTDNKNKNLRRSKKNKHFSLHYRQN